jgi:hypothetical protein
MKYYISFVKRNSLHEFGQLINFQLIRYTGWSKKFCAPDDYDIESYK